MIQREEKQDDGRKEAWSWIYDKEGRLLQTVAEDGNCTTTEVWTYLEDGGKHYQKNTLSKGQIKTESCEYDLYGNRLREYDNGILVRENTYVPLSKALWEE